jgi:hypothetical protein
MQAGDPKLQAPLARLADAGADAGQITDVAMSTWHDVAVALSPIIGHAAVTALFKRSLYLTRAGHPCLAAAYGAIADTGEFGALQAALERQTGAAAAAAGDALQHTFCELLADLIGASLTERLLRSVRNTPSSGHAVQDTSP